MEEVTELDLPDREVKKDKSDRKTINTVLDKRAFATLRKLKGAGHFTELLGVISTGKEASVYAAELRSRKDETSEGQVVEDVETTAQEDTVEYRAVKIYATAILAFKDRTRYMEGDRRFASYKTSNNYHMVKAWSEKEFRNLMKLHADGIPVPRPYKQKNNVLVMQFLGDDKGYPYPRLVDVTVDENEGQRLYRDLLANMRRMYQVSKLVHGDLSEYNLLYHDGRLFFIDVSQSVGHDHPDSLVLLRRDIENVNRFFGSRGADTLLDRTVFEFVLSKEAPVKTEELGATLDELYRSHPETPDSSEARARQEVENEVFRKSHIPRTLNEIADIEFDSKEVRAGQNADLLHIDLLADLSLKDKPGEGDVGGSSDSSPDTDSGDEDGDEGEDNNAGFEHREPGRPRGHRFESSEEKRARKREVKDQKWERRQTKMKKYDKQKAIEKTKRSKR